MTDCTGIAFDISFRHEWLVKITFYMETECHNLTQASAGILKWGGGSPGALLGDGEKETSINLQKKKRGLQMCRNHWLVA